MCGIYRRAKLGNIRFRAQCSLKISRGKRRCQVKIQIITRVRRGQSEDIRLFSNVLGTAGSRRARTRRTYGGRKGGGWEGKEGRVCEKRLEEDRSVAKLGGPGVVKDS